MLENAQNTEAVAGEVDTAERTVKKTRKSPEREEVRLAKNPAKLISKEGFALYIGKTVDAVVAMAKAAKAPAIYMADPLNPGGNAELYFDREEWDEACRQLVENAPPEWHDWRNRLFLFKPTSRKGRKSTKHNTQQAA
ncbi:Cox family DNA-binding protein [Salmonella enterica]|uniref:Cox family DNA-binding protein n=1 Tax=Salmonella enterica TaxID=28901 RepID=UPI003D17C7A4